MRMLYRYVRELRVVYYLFPVPHIQKEKNMKQKLRTHKAMAKRVKVTASGKFLRRKVAINHLRRHKSPEAVRAMDKMFQLKPSDTRRMKRLLPYAY
ncbi:MAG: hypothetical protein PVS3B3_25430 [Ktedonobacteraceae bacterium]